MHNAYLNGTNHSAADQEAVVEVQKAIPDVFYAARENHSFLSRCVRYMLGQRIKQFIEVGRGFLISDNIHELVQSVDPVARIVYVDGDPVVVEHGSKHLATNGTTTIICANIRQPQDILNNSKLACFIDFLEPVGILMRVS